MKKKGIVLSISFKIIALLIFLAVAFFIIMTLKEGSDALVSKILSVL